MFCFVFLWYLVVEEQLLSKFSVNLDCPFPDPLMREAFCFVLSALVGVSEFFSLACPCAVLWGYQCL